ncbi:hypothetical protein C3V36_01645 [Lachnospiraceae bacterium oral taxon 500]|nr:hypothetical protein C3V36_01645 [Lachnospiraceae bacterium oral taxon 500]
MIKLLLKAEDREQRLVAALVPELDFELTDGPADWELEAEAKEAAASLKVVRSGRKAKIEGRLCDLGRGLSLLHQYRMEESVAIEEKPAFAKCGA